MSDVIEKGKAAERAMSGYLSRKLDEIERELYEAWKSATVPFDLETIKGCQFGVDKVRASIQADIDAGRMAQQGQ